MRDCKSLSFLTCYVSLLSHHVCLSFSLPVPSVSYTDSKSMCALHSLNVCAYVILFRLFFFREDKEETLALEVGILSGSTVKSRDGRHLICFSRTNLLLRERQVRIFSDHWTAPVWVPRSNIVLGIPIFDCLCGLFGLRLAGAFRWKFLPSTYEFRRGGIEKPPAVQNRFWFRTDGSIRQATSAAVVGF